MKQYFSILRETVLFHSMAEEQLHHLLQSLHAEIKQYEKGQYCIVSQQPFYRVCILIEGTANIIREQMTGNQSLLSELEAGDMFAESYVFAKTPHIPVSVIATSDCKVLCLDFHHVELKTNQYDLYQCMMERMLAIIASKNVAMNEKMDLLNQRTMRGKILHYLDRMAKEKGTPCFEIPFDRTELADFLGVERSALSRELGKMQNEGLIHFKRNWFTLIGR